jgi:hypothetical protein
VVVTSSCVVPMDSGKDRDPVKIYQAGYSNDLNLCYATDVRC